MVLIGIDPYPYFVNTRKQYSQMGPNGAKWIQQLGTVYKNREWWMDPNLKLGDSGVIRIQIRMLPNEVLWEQPVFQEG
jgi:hypothetical protein